MADSLTVADTLAMFDKGMGANEHGEIPGICSAWACDDFGRPGHNYHTCPVCHANYDRRMKGENK